MQNLKKLQMNRVDGEWMAFLIFQNAKTLRVVHGISRLPVSPPLVFPKLVILECCVFDDEIAESCPNLVDLTLKDTISDMSLLDLIILPLPTIMMPKLRRLHLFEATRDATEFVARHAMFLKELDFKGSFPMQHNDEPITYNALQKLNIADCAEGLASFENCPKLQRLAILDMSHVISLSDLPVDSMERLAINWRPKFSEPLQTLNDIIGSFKRLVNLTELLLFISSKNISIKDGNIVATLFDNLHMLEDVKIEFRDEPKPNMDLMVERLVRGNRQLNVLTLLGMELSDPVVDSMSQLPDLQSVEINGCSLTTSGVMKLLTGPSARSLLYLKVDSAVRVNMNQVEEQFVLMMTGRGLHADDSEWYKKPASDDFCFSAKVV